MCDAVLRLLEAGVLAYTTDKVARIGVGAQQRQSPLTLSDMRPTLVSRSSTPHVAPTHRIVASLVMEMTERMIRLAAPVAVSMTAFINALSMACSGAPAALALSIVSLIVMFRSPKACPPSAAVMALRYLAMTRGMPVAFILKIFLFFTIV